MHRRSPGAQRVLDLQDALLATLKGLPIGEVIQQLEPLLTEERKARLNSVFSTRLNSVTLVMDAPYDPHNGAAVLRTADAMGLSEVHIVERKQPFLSVRTVARGSERWVHVHTAQTTDVIVKQLRSQNYELIGATASGTLVPSDLANIPRVAIVMGNERDGIEQELQAACSRFVKIPMRGFAESLNVSVAAAILLQHATHGRPGDLPKDEQDYLYARALILTVPHAAELLDARGMKLNIPGLS